MKINKINHFFKNSAWMMSEKLVSIVSGLVVGLMVIKYLGPSEYGKIAYILSITGVLSFLIHLGMNNIVIKYFKDTKYTNQEVFGTSIWIRFLFGSLFFVVVNLIVYFYKPELLILSIPISISVFLDIFYVIYSYFISIEKPKQNTKAFIASVIISAIIKLILIYFEFSVEYFAMVYLLESLIKYYILHSLYKKFETGKFIYNKKLAKILLKESAPLLISGVVVSLYMNVDVIMIEYFYNLESVGIYATAVKLVMVWMMIPSILSLVIYPKLIESKNKNDTRFTYKISLFYSVMFYVSLFIGLFMYFSSKLIIDTLFNENFIQSIGVIKIYIWCIIFYFLGQATEKYFILNNKTKYMSYNAIIGLFINVILNYVWIPKYGIEGAAYASVISTAYSALFGLILFKNTRYVLYEILKSILLINILKKEKNGRY